MVEDKETEKRKKRLIEQDFIVIADDHPCRQCGRPADFGTAVAGPSVEASSTTRREAA